MKIIKIMKKQKFRSYRSYRSSEVENAAVTPTEVPVSRGSELLNSRTPELLIFIVKRTI